MVRTSIKIPNKDLPPQFSEQILHWAATHETFAWLDSNDYPQQYSSFEKALALGTVSVLESDYSDAFKKLEHYTDAVKDYVFGYLSYDLKNDIENLSSENPDGLYFPDLFFFQPQKLFIFHTDFVEIKYHQSCAAEWKDDLQTIQKFALETNIQPSKFEIKQRISKETYTEKVTQLKKHITRGDTYETNFCMEFYAKNVVLHPLQVFQELNSISKTPFAVFFKHKHHYLLSASPERFVRKEGQNLITQPIKGTAKRSADCKEDLDLKTQLEKSTKERSENIMIVDLVRNDLSKTASKGSVQVTELCRVYSFPSVHQMISTVTSVVKDDIHVATILKSLFPMGSMTGAPKYSTMKIIEELEMSKRGLYSGGFGYITPQGDFDFNVLIRSILYNMDEKYLSYTVGGAITDKSNVMDEYQECLIKTQNIRQTLDKFLIPNSH